MRRVASVLLLCMLVAGSVAAAKKKTKASTSPKIPAGTAVHVRIIEDLTSAKAQPGDAFHGTLAEPLVSGSQTLYPKGADVTGRVVGAKPSGRLKDPGVLELEITRISDGVRATKVTSEPFQIKGESHTKSNVTKIGGGAAAGAVIGAIAGGGKGAAIGAAVGAAAGTGVAAATGKKEATVESEAVLTFTVAGSTPSAVQPAAAKAPEPAAKEYNESEPGPAEARSFSARDRRVIRTCFEEHKSSLPPGLAKREQLPPGLQRQLEKNGTLPPGLQKRVQPLPEVCERELPRLPSILERVIYGPRVMLLEKNVILDYFDLDAGE